jgi:hypothetical protein
MRAIGRMVAFLVIAQYRERIGPVGFGLECLRNELARLRHRQRRDFF